MNTTIKEKTVFLSRKGLKELKKSINQLEHDVKKAVRSLREIDKTDIHDNRLIRIEKLSNIEAIQSELNDKKTTLANSKLLKPERNRLQVAIGSVVELIDRQGRLLRFTIVDSIEANPSDGRISTLSPLGQSLIGRTVKDIVQWGSGKNFNQFQLVRIS